MLRAHTPIKRAEEMSSSYSDLQASVDSVLLAALITVRRGRPSKLCAAVPSPVPALDEHRVNLANVPNNHKTNRLVPARKRLP